MLFPTTPDAAQAEEATEASPRATTSVSLTVPATIEFADVMATPSGATTTASAKIGVTTTASAGYKLYLYAKDNSLKSLNPNTTQSIASASASSLDNFTNNTWGYNLTEGTTAGTTYSALPTTNTTPTQTKDTSTTNSANDTYTLSLGAKVDSTIPSGTYTSTLTISVVAEPKKITTLTEMTTMQEMTPEICTNSQEGDTVRIADERDGKMYWIAKLKDGNCWMTQNLDYDIPEEGIVGDDAVKTDLPDGTTWATGTATAANPYPATATEPEGTITSNTSDIGTFSWDIGYYVKSTPNSYSNYCTDIKALDDPSCTSAGWVNVDDSTGYVALTEEQTDGVSSGSTVYSVVVVDEQAKTYDAHYLVGNLYQWTAATAGTGGSFSSGANATGSICPKGWTLPTGGNGGGYYNLVINRYNIGNNSVGSAVITYAPLYFSPVGYIGAGSLYSAGNIGYYWSATANSSTDAYDFDFYSSGINPSSDGHRYSGESVRCLAR